MIYTTRKERNLLSLYQKVNWVLKETLDIAELSSADEKTTLRKHVLKNIVFEFRPLSTKKSTASPKRIKPTHFYKVPYSVKFFTGLISIALIFIL